MSSRENIEGDILFQISNKLREERTNRGVTIQSVADNAGVSKSLVSQVENNRITPSLPLLLNLINALGLDLNVFFKEFVSKVSSAQVLIVKRQDYEPFKEENSYGFFYRRILSKEFEEHKLDVFLLRLFKDSRRPMTQTNAYIFSFILQGSVSYFVGRNQYVLKEGDSIFFDGNELHNPKCIDGNEVLLLIVHFIDNPNNI